MLLRKSNKSFTYILFIIFFFFLGNACQRGLDPYPTPTAEGYILKDNNGNCEPVIINGNYYKTQTLNDSNYLLVDVNITSAGTYKISTDTINGYFFEADGTFNSIGTVHVKLLAEGKPTEADSDYFTIRFNESFCEAKVVVSDSSLDAATFSFDGENDICSNDSVYGNFIKSIALDTDASVKINVNVVTAGTYSIATNKLNGYSFSGEGTFLQTGIQPVLLHGSGTPLQQTTDVFTVNSSTSSSCSFAVDVLTTIAAKGNDYFPLTINNYWTYDDLVNGDTLKRTVVDSTLINNNFYKEVREDVAFGGPYQYFFRKAGSDYFEYAAPNEYTTFFQYKKPVEAEIPILKENLSVNATWQSPTYIDTTSDGSIIKLKYDFTCLQNNAFVTLNGKAFANVYVIKMLPAILSTTDFEYTNEMYVFYYAKGIGLIYLKKKLSGFTQKELRIRNWFVN